jgi:hypothetical protein
VVFDEKYRRVEVIAHFANQLAELIKLFVIEPGSGFI